MPLNISLVTAHFCEYLEIELGLFTGVKRKLVVTSYLPKIITMVVMKIRAKLFFVVPDQMTRGKTVLAVGCQTGHKGESFFTTRAV